LKEFVVHQSRLLCAGRNEEYTVRMITVIH
jgi:hypothetical protein